MRIAVFCPLLSPWSRQAVLRLVEFGHEVHIFDFSNPGRQIGYLDGHTELFAQDIAKLRSQVSGVHLIDARITSPIRYIVYAPELGWVCQKIRADILLVLWGGGWSLMSYLSGFRPYVVFVGGGDVLRVGGLQRCISGFALKNAKVVFANGQYLAEKTRELAPKARVVPLYYGVDPVRFTPSEPTELPCQIVCTRGFAEVYNNQYLIEGLAYLPRSLPDLQVVFTSPGRLLQNTQSLADRLLPNELRSRVQFLNGVTDDGMLAVLRRSQVYVSLAKSDGTSISLLEALSCGLFPILTDIPQNREWINPTSGKGLLVPLDQPKVLAEALATAILDDEMRIRAREANRQLVLQRADSHNTMATLATKLEEIMHSKQY